eukprot:TRINITY_DN4764_c0_g1_i1.p1 TRINITY_DN4764_c0_g1~~TRINITY_DN4764_c0_g1_i1.p1  ORF type:complete len:1018 (-),score=238.72 TRINITY_DN4764_c0_g1_i1:12-3065(-)
MEEKVIDETLYSRQLYVMGTEAMKKMANSNVFISGMDGLGVEIAKNICLAGVKSLTCHDHKNAVIADLSSQFFLAESDVGKNRATVSAPKLAELNPYTAVYSKTEDLTSVDLTYFDSYTCVCLISSPLSLQIKVDEYCRSKGIKFISASSFGSFITSFVDFGVDFEIFDTNGEELAESLIAQVSNEKNALITCLSNERHNFDVADHIELSSMQGLESLNGKTFEITEIAGPYSFRINADTSSLGKYVSGGLARQRRTVKKETYKSLSSSLEEPEFNVVDFSKFTMPGLLLLAFQALDNFQETHGRLPSAWDSSDADKFLNISKEINDKKKDKQEIDESLFKRLAYTSTGSLVGLNAFFGGLLAQEVLKGISGKFTPLKQWLNVDVLEVVPGVDSDPSLFKPRNDRYDALRVLLGQDVLEKIFESRLFMIGCGAIGCEMLKNYAMLGFGSKGSGLISITDNDLIEKSNLNRQFLFRPSNINQPKSTTAATAVKIMNPSLNIDSKTDKVCKESENIFTDEFFSNQTIVVNALDNVEARLYVDSRCVDNSVPLMESGTMGTKGHVQNIIPHKTANYSMTIDPPEGGFPFCTLKSFPSKVVHTIQWARDKFQTNFTLKPRETTQFMQDSSGEGYWDRFRAKQPSKQDVKRAIRMLTFNPSSFDDCLHQAKKDFLTYFRNAIKQLLFVYPPDYVKDNQPFWAPPRKLPTAIEFDSSKKDHLDFVFHTAALYAQVFNIQITTKDYAELAKIIDSISIPEYQIKKDKYIEADENATQEQVEAMKEKKRLQESYQDGEFESMVEQLITLTKSAKQRTPEEFEKDVDSNHHIDYITAASNIRAEQYGIETADRLQTKKIAGKIIPAMATSTAAVSGLVSIEMIKVVKGITNLESYKNAWINLALPLIMFSEPQPCPVTKVGELELTLWTKRWDVKKGNLALGQFLNYFKKEYSLKVTGVFYGVTMVYADLFPNHKSRLPQKMSKLLDVGPEVEYVDLDCQFELLEKEEEVKGPKVRFYFKQQSQDE